MQSKLSKTVVVPLGCVRREDADKDSRFEEPLDLEMREFHLSFSRQQASGMVVRYTLGARLALLKEASTAAHISSLGEVAAGEASTSELQEKSQSIFSAGSQPAHWRQWSGVPHQAPAWHLLEMMRALHGSPLLAG